MKLEQVAELRKLEEMVNDSELSPNARKEIQKRYREKLEEFNIGENGLTYQELEMTGTTLNVHQDISTTANVVPLHSHSFYEIMLCHSGHIQYLIGNSRYQLQPGDVVLITPGNSHRPLFPARLSEPYKRTVVWVNADFYASIAALFHLEESDSPDKHIVSGILRPSGRISNQIEQIFYQMLQAKKHKNTEPGSNFLCDSLFMQLVYQFYQISLKYRDHSIIPEKKALLDKIIEYVENHYSEQISLSSTADVFHISSSYVSQIFKKQMGMGFYQYVTQRRLIESKNCIINGIPMKEIPYHCGFSDYSVFYKAFTNEYGISPRQFQRHEQ